MIRQFLKLLAVGILSSSLIISNAFADGASTTGGGTSVDLNSGNATNTNLTKNDNIFTYIFKDFCWGCIFPIYVAGIKMPSTKSASSYHPSAAVSPNKRICFCKDAFGNKMPGFTTGMWEPARLIEFVKKPGKMAVFGGIDSGVDKIGEKIPKFGRKLSYGTLGDAGVEQDTESDHFMHYHYYAFPVLIMFEMYINKGCGKDGLVDFDMLFVSEIDPTWTNPGLAFFASPMAALFANPLAILACIPDAIASAYPSKVMGPIDALFWCAGSWGGVYPANGVTAGFTSFTAISNMTARVLTSLHTRGQAMKYMGKEAQCRRQFYPVLPKSQYAITTLRPFAENKSKHYIGQTEIAWALSKNIPTNDYISAIWRWRDCCARP